MYTNSFELAIKKSDYTWVLEFGREVQHFSYVRKHS